MCRPKLKPPACPSPSHPTPLRGTHWHPPENEATLKVPHLWKTSRTAVGARRRSAAKMAEIALATEVHAIDAGAGLGCGGDGGAGRGGGGDGDEGGGGG